MKEYADQIREEIIRITEGPSTSDGLELYKQMGQLTEVEKSIIKYKQNDLLNKKEARELSKLRLDSYQSIRNRLSPSP
jgi:hypothetical protein